MNKITKIIFLTFFVSLVLFPFSNVFGEEETSVGTYGRVDVHSYWKDPNSNMTSSALVNTTVNAEKEYLFKLTLASNVEEVSDFRYVNVKNVELWLREDPRAPERIFKVNDLPYNDWLSSTPTLLPITGYSGSVDIYAFVYYDVDGVTKYFNTNPTSLGIEATIDSDDDALPSPVVLPSPESSEDNVATEIGQETDPGNTGLQLPTNTEITNTPQANNTQAGGIAEFSFPKNCASSQGEEVLYCFLGKTFNFLFWLIGILTVLMIILSGFLFMTSSGNPEGVTKAKNALIATVVGAVITVSAWAIVEYTKNVLAPDYNPETSTNQTIALPKFSDFANEGEACKYDSDCVMECECVDQDITGFGICKKK